MIADVRAWLAAAALCLASHPASAASRVIDLVNEAASLTPGDFVWADLESAGQPVSIVISIPDQKAYVYRGAALMAVTTVSTGRAGHLTPLGTFTILQKQVMHHSNKYDDAPMPFMERLTWDGVAIHGGYNPGHPASHGCVRVPLDFARRLYAITRLGAVVTITDSPVLEAVPSVPAVDAVDVTAIAPAPRVSDPTMDTAEPN